MAKINRVGFFSLVLNWICVLRSTVPGGGGGVLPDMGYIGMCRCEGYGFQAVYSRIGYINQSVWVWSTIFLRY